MRRFEGALLFEAAKLAEGGYLGPGMSPDAVRDGMRRVLRNRRDKPYFEMERRLANDRVFQRVVRARKYGLSEHHLFAMLRWQEYKCHCCGVGITDADCVIDHDHKNGEVRGLLCTSCNTLLGRMGDERDAIIKRCEQLLTYLSHRRSLTKVCIAVERKRVTRSAITAACAPEPRWTRRIAKALTHELVLLDLNRVLQDADRSRVRLKVDDVVDQRQPRDFMPCLEVFRQNHLEGCES